MKTRIISGIVMALIVGGILAGGFLWQSILINITVALLAVAAIYELLHNAIGVQSHLTLIGASVYAAITVFSIDDYNNFDSIIIPTIFYCIYAVIMILVNHKSFDLAKIICTYALPIPFVLAFCFLCGIITSDNGIYYLLLLLIFSSVCDMGAYFTGVTIGKHKLCPEISPKKTVEGAIGGIVCSLIFTGVVSYLFGEFSISLLLLTVPFCVLGMLGDLFASAIKRSVSLKDYGDIIPGHGGIMDRLDSILMITPFMFVSLYYGWL